MKLTRLERAVLRRFLEDEGVGSELDLGSIKVVSRDLTGAGFFANRADQAELRLFPPHTADRRGEVHTAVGDRETMVGFVFGIRQLVPGLVSAA